MNKPADETMAATWLTWTQRLQSIAQAGLTYARDPFDLERYRQLRALASEIVAAHLKQPVEAIEAAFEAERGYLTPKVDVRAVVFQEGKILMVREQADGLWSLPGGWADVGESPAENTAREVLEETGYVVRPSKLLAVHDKAKHNHPPGLWYIYTLFFRCDLLAGAPITSHETTEVGFFYRNALPPLSTPRVNEVQIGRMFAHYDTPDLPTDFELAHLCALVLLPSSLSTREASPETGGCLGRARAIRHR